MNITRKILQQMADDASFTRGEDYFRRGLVGNINYYQNKLIAKVIGTEIYHVKLWEYRKQLQYECSCPRGDEGDFCKHCVAVGLAWLKKGKNKNANANRITPEDIRECLLQQNKSILTDIIMEQALKNDLLMQKLSLKIAKLQAIKYNIRPYQHIIDQAVFTDDFVDYYQTSSYAKNLNAIIDSIEELLHEKQAEVAIQLVEYMLPKVEEALNHVDDSNGAVGSILSHLEEIFYQACLKIKPDVKELAQKLFQWELQAQWGTFYDIPGRYGKILGRKGLAIYQSLAEAEWKEMKPTKVSSQYEDQNEAEYGKYDRIAHIMENLARKTGDIEALVAIKKCKLSHSYDYLAIAEIYYKDKQFDKAIEWGEKGIENFPLQSHAVLRDFLAEAYHRVGQDKKAIDQIWQQFLTSESLSNYQNLKKYSCYINQWSHWREKAITKIRKTIGYNNKMLKKKRWNYKFDHTLLVEIYLWENDIEAAWAEAKSGGCRHSLWLELAEKREKSHPQDAIAVYQAEIESRLDLKNNDAYMQAVNYLQKIHRLMNSLAKKQVFEDYLANLRITHKLKRNLIKLLDKAKL